MTIKHSLLLMLPLAWALCSPAQAANIPLKVATNGSIAKLNLNHSLQRAQRRRDAQPNSPTAAQAYVDLLLMRLQFYRDYADLDLMTQECERFSDDARTAAQLLCADVDAARHNFVSALERIAHVTEREGHCGSGNRRIAAIAATLSVELSELATESNSLEEKGSAGTGDAPTYQDQVILAAIDTASGNVTAATNHYVNAVESYADVSPYPIAWAWYQVAELQKRKNPDFAIRYYEAALDYLPDYIAPRVELAALQLDLGMRASALNHLHYAEKRSADPDIQALLYRALENAPEDKLANAEAGFATLMERHPFAFADHASEVYATTNVAKAKELGALLDEQKSEVKKRISTLSENSCATSRAQTRG